MGMARRYIPLREAGKAALHKGLDGGRAAARTRGAELVAEGAIGDVDEVFHLTLDEVLTQLPRDVAATVAHRRALREAYRAVDVPRHWVGEPVPVPITGADEGARVREVRGTGASHGCVEGRARICRSAEECDALEHGEILVCRATNPGWASAFPLVRGMVIDIGSPGSHAAIIAREMGLPCVIGTERGTSLLRTGDLVRVDGTSGLVEVLEVAAPVADAVEAAAEGGAPAPDGAPAAGRPATEHELLVMRLLNLKGRAGAAQLAGLLDLDVAAVGAVLDAAVAADEVKLVRDAARLTAAGRERVAVLLAEARTDVDPDLLEDLYERFHAPNDALKQLMTRWQTRADATPNDHIDAAYDDGVARELTGFHREQAELVAQVGVAAPLLSSYVRRLDQAAARVAAGDHASIAAPLEDSYHTAWFELHDDLILLLGRSRADEAAAGRAV